ncbi:MAG: HAD hydrolase-like protein [Candidatus Levyibacteriota bacterium]
MKFNPKKIVKSKVALFDLDGTVFSAANKLHDEATNVALKQVYEVGTLKSQIVNDGMTDMQLIIEVLKLHGLTKPQVMEKFPQMLKVMNDYFMQRVKSKDYSALPGVRKLAEHFRANGVPNGILTGNPEKIAWKKLEIAGVKHLFDFGAFGDKTDKRVELVDEAKEKIDAKYGIDFPVGNFVIIGDTPKDIQCARDAEIPVLAVSTGRFSYEQLALEKPDILVKSLEELENIAPFFNLS